MKKYQHIFFDLDHTIWDFESNARETIYDIYNINQIDKLGVDDFNEFYKQYSIYNHQLWSKYTKGLIKQEELKWKRMYLALLHYKIANEELAKKMSNDFVGILPNKTNLFPYSIEILEYLKSKNYQLHLITNGFENLQTLKLKNTHINHFFEVMVTSEASNSLKPNKEIFEFALSKTNATIENSIMIGDNIEADIDGAINVGLDTIYVNHLNNEKYNKATYTIFHLKDLEDIL